MSAAASTPPAVAARESAAAVGGGPAAAVPRPRGFWRRLRPSRRELGVAIASGLMFALAFPPLPGVALAFVCLVPLAVYTARVADHGGAGGPAARAGAWFAVVGFGIALYWIAVALSLFTSLAFLAYVATLLGMAGLVALTTTALYLARRQTRWPMAILLPATWVSLELLLTYFSDLAFPWFPLGLAVATHPTLAQAADLSGVHGLSVWIAATNGLLADAWLAARVRTVVRGSAGLVDVAVGREQTATPSEFRAGTRAATANMRSRPVLVPLAIAAILFAGAWAYGAWRLRSVVITPLARIAIVQPNIPEDEKMQQAMRDHFIDPLAALTRQEAARERSQLILWPETALPDFLANHPDWTDSLTALARDTRTPILFGMIDATITGPGPRDFDYFNAATMVDSVGRLGAQPAYHKAYLVPIVERVPFLDPHWFAGLKYFGGFGRGSSARPFQLPFGRVGVLICYESIFPQQARRYRLAGADVIVNLTNDAWFGHGTAPYQHEAHLRLRAIENRVGIVRAANTGISEYIDPLGRSHGATGLFVPAALSYAAGTTSLRSLYVVWGDWAGGGAAVLTAGLMLWVAARRRGARRSAPGQTSPAGRGR